MTTYDFNEQNSKGQAAERFIDSCFADKFIIREATRYEQLNQGIDRHYTNRERGNKFTVEYKTDWKAWDTHNAYIETTSVDYKGSPGWAVKTQSHRVFYYLPQAELLYVLRTPVIRSMLAQWERLYPTVPAHNRGYKTWGILVPIEDIEANCEMVCEMPPYTPTNGGAS
jgi:hypothetical protein